MMRGGDRIRSGKRFPASWGCCISQTGCWVPAYFGGHSVSLVCLNSWNEAKGVYVKTKITLTKGRQQQGSEQEDRQDKLSEPPSVDSWLRATGKGPRAGWGWGGELQVISTWKRKLKGWEIQHIHNRVKHGKTLF